jgi:hypothetical protein
VPIIPDEPAMTILTRTSSRADGVPASCAVVKIVVKRIVVV